MRDPTMADQLSARHPVVWHHPVTHAPVLYVNPWMTERILGRSSTDSDELLRTLVSYVLDRSVSYRHRWLPGDFVIWDNIALLHARTAYDPAQPRRLYRLQLGLP